MPTPFQSEYLDDPNSAACFVSIAGERMPYFRHVDEKSRCFLDCRARLLKILCEPSVPVSCLASL